MAVEQAVELCPLCRKLLLKPLRQDAGTYSLGVICWRHLTHHVQGNLKISRPVCFVADGLCSPVYPSA